MRSIVYFYTHVLLPFASAAELLSREPGLWLPGPGDAVGDEFRLTLHADGALRDGMAEHEALVSVSAPSWSELTLLRRISWRSATADRLVPMLDADLELVALDGTGCQLSLMGSYRPPLSVIGAAGDRLLGHRVAEACVRRFVLDVAERVESTLLQRAS